MKALKLITHSILIATTPTLFAFPHHSLPQINTRIEEASSNKLQINFRRKERYQLGRPSQRYIGKKAEVVINPETRQIVSINPTSTKKANKLIDGLSNVKDSFK